MTHDDVIIFEKLKLEKNAKTDSCKHNFEIPSNPPKDMNITRFTCLRFARQVSPPYLAWMPWHFDVIVLKIVISISWYVEELLKLSKSKKTEKDWPALVWFCMKKACFMKESDRWNFDMILIIWYENDNMINMHYVNNVIFLIIIFNVILWVTNHDQVWAFYSTTNWVILI